MTVRPASALRGAAPGRPAAVLGRRMAGTPCEGKRLSGNQSAGVRSRAGLRSAAGRSGARSAAASAAAAPEGALLPSFWLCLHRPFRRALPRPDCCTARLCLLLSPGRPCPRRYASPPGPRAPSGACRSPAAATAARRPRVRPSAGQRPRAPSASRARRRASARDVMARPRLRPAAGAAASVRPLSAAPEPPPPGRPLRLLSRVLRSAAPCAFSGAALMPVLIPAVRRHGLSG